MARWRLVEPKLFVLLLLLAGTAAHPLSPTNSRQLVSTPYLGSTIHKKVRQSLTARVSQDGQPDTTIDDHGGFSVASIVGVAVSATFTLAVIISLSYSAYYRHAKLKLHRQYLERLGPFASQAQNQEADVSPEAAIPDEFRSMRTAARAHGLAGSISSSAQFATFTYSAAQEHQLESPTAPVEAKAKAAVEDKVLGRREDLLPLGREFGHAARNGQMLVAFRPAFR